MEINDIAYGNPPLEYIKSWEDKGLEKFREAKQKGVLDEFISKYPHPANDSEETKAELKLLTEKTGKLTSEEKKLCDDLDEDIYEFFEKFCDKIGLDVREDELEAVADKYWGIVSYIKFKLNRPRPFQLGWYYKLKLFPNVQSKSANSAAYPSGHTFEFLLLIDYLTKKHPEHKEKFGQLYKKIRDVRILSGVHYPSDTKGSEILFKMLKDKGIIN